MTVEELDRLCDCKVEICADSTNLETRYAEINYLTINYGDEEGFIKPSSGTTSLIYRLPKSLAFSFLEKAADIDYVGGVSIIRV